MQLRPWSQDQDGRHKPLQGGLYTVAGFTLSKVAQAPSKDKDTDAHWMVPIEALLSHWAKTLWPSWDTKEGLQLAVDLGGDIT